MIGILGINHKTASIDIRGLFSIHKSEINELSLYLKDHAMISEVVILSTCNRTEIYFYKKDGQAEDTAHALIDLIHNYKAVTKDYSRNFYFYYNTDAIRHLFSVTSGLDSMVLGEVQIVNQVKEAYIYCTDLALTDAVLMRMFQKSFETGKKVRTDTTIQQGATSVSYVAVDKCQKEFGYLSDKKVLFVGVGETGRLVLQLMRKQGVTKFGFTNRTCEKSKTLAEEHQGEALEFNDFINHIENYDIIVTATNAGKVLVSVDDVKDAIKERSGNKQVYIDLSVPRNIHHGVVAIKEVSLITIDNLQDIIDKNASLRMQSRQKALEIIDSMVKEFVVWYGNRSLQPVIKTITSNLKNLHCSEIQGYSKQFNGEILEAVDHYASRLTQKITRTFIKNLRELNERGESLESLDVIKDLFVFDSENT